VRQVDIDFADNRKRYTKTFARYVLELSRLMTIQDVARHLRISWDTVKDIQKQYLQQRFAKPKLGQIRHLAIDEIYLGKRSGFVTLVMDLDSGAVVEVAQGKHADALLPFWKRLHRSRARIRAVATDMGPAQCYLDKK
jgi:transposase